MLTTEDIPR